MINKIMPVCNTHVNKTANKVSFGMANLNEIGRQSEDSFGYQANSFLDTNMYKKTPLFQDAAIKAKLENEKFEDICLEYGCTTNPKANADFIKNQVLSSKGEKATKTVEEDSLQKGLQALYKHNYDNPALSADNTKALLEKIKDSLPSEEYIQQVGVMNAGTKKK